MESLHVVVGFICRLEISMLLDAQGSRIAVIGDRLRKLAIALLLACPISGFVGSDAIGPGAEQRRVVKAMEVAHDRKQGFLEHIPRRVAPAGQTPSVAPEPRLPTSDQLLQRFGFAALTA